MILRYLQMMLSSLYLYLDLQFRKALLIFTYRLYHLRQQNHRLRNTIPHYFLRHYV